MAKFCQNCGSPLPESGKFCQQCGTPIPESAAAPTPVPAPEPQPAPEPTQPAAPPMPVMPPVPPASMPQPTDRPAPAYPTAGAPGTYVTPPKKSKTGLIIAVIAAALVVLGVLAFFGFRDGGFLRGGSSSPAAVRVKGDTEKHGYYKVLVPEGYTLSKGTVLDETDPEAFTLEKDGSLFTYFMFGLFDRESARDNIDVTKEVNEGAKSVSVTYNDVTWTGVAYQSFGYDCFSMYADFNGQSVVVSAAGNAYDSDITNAILSSLRVSTKAATTTEAPTTTTTEPTTTTTAPTTTTTTAALTTLRAEALVGEYSYTGTYREYFGDTTVDSGELEGLIEVFLVGSELNVTFKTEESSGATLTMSYDPATGTATCETADETFIESITLTFYQSGGQMHLKGVIQDDYPYSDIPSGTYQLEATRAD